MRLTPGPIVFQFRSLDCASLYLFIWPNVVFRFGCVHFACLFLPSVGNVAALGLIKD